MTDIIKMDYGLMEDMSKTFKESVEQLKDTMSQMQSIANAMEKGALRGKGGDAFTEAVRNKLCPAIGRLTDKYEELARDILDAMRDMKEADETSKSELAD